NPCVSSMYVSRDTTRSASTTDLIRSDATASAQFVQSTRTVQSFPSPSSAPVVCVVESYSVHRARDADFRLTAQRRVTRRLIEQYLEDGTPDFCKRCLGQTPTRKDQGHRGRLMPDAEHRLAGFVGHHFIVRSRLQLPFARRARRDQF